MEVGFLPVFIHLGAIVKDARPQALPDSSSHGSVESLDLCKEKRVVFGHSRMCMGRFGGWTFEAFLRW